MPFYSSHLMVLLMTVMMLTTAEEIDNDKEIVLLRNRLMERKKREHVRHAKNSLDLPPASSSIHLSSPCQLHSIGCPSSYREWLTKELDTTAAGVDHHQVSVSMNREIDLLKESLIIQQKTFSQLEIEVDAAVLAANVSCRGLMPSWAEIIVSDEQLLSALQSSRGHALQIGRGNFIPFICLRLLPCTLVVALAVWLFAEAHVDKELLRDILLAHRRQQVASTIVSYQWVKVMQRMRIVMSLVMLMFVIFTIWSLPKELSNSLWWLRWIVPIQYFELAAMALCGSYTIAAVIAMIHEVNTAWSDYLTAQRKCAVRVDRLLVAVDTRPQTLITSEELNVPLPIALH